MTTGVDIVGALLRAYPALIAVVAVPSIKAGALPDGTPLPAILVRRVSKVSRQQLVRGPLTRKVDRVAVAVRAASYREQVAIIGLIEDCCVGQTGDIGGGLRVSILDAGTGPDVRGPADSFEQTQDLRVSYDA